MATSKVDMDRTSMTAGQLAGHLIGLLTKVKDDAFGSPHFQAIHEGRDPFASPKVANADVNDKVEWWTAHYKGLYRINPDFSGLVVPEQKVGFDRLVIVPKGLTYKKWVETALTIHAVSLYTDDLDGAITKSDRTPEKSYAVWIRDRQEADEEFKNVSAVVAEEKKIKGVTLLERLLAGTAHLFDRYAHMDVENWTLCSGSRFSDGDVPYVVWNPGKRYVYVGYCDPRDSYPFLRLREAVTL